MSQQRMSDTPHALSTGGPPPPILAALYYLGAFALLLTVPCVIASLFLANADQAKIALTIGIAGLVVGPLCWGLIAVLLYRHAEWSWPLSFVKNSGIENLAITRHEHAFLVAWACFVIAAGFGALAVLIAIQGLSGLKDPNILIGPAIVFWTIGVPVWIISRRMRRRTQGAR